MSAGDNVAAAGVTVWCAIAALACAAMIGVAPPGPLSPEQK
jgi:hypothetical protein